MALKLIRASVQPVKSKAFLVLLLGAVLGLWLSTSGCGPTCPGNEPNCGTSNPGAAGAAGTAGAAGASNNGTCSQLTALQNCLGAFCKGSDSPFCSCYNKGYDLAAAPACTCQPFDPVAYCAQAQANGIDTSDCSAVSSSVATQCVGVTPQ